MGCPDRPGHTDPAGAQRAGHPAPGTTLRALRQGAGHRSPPHPQAGRSETTGTSSTPRLGDPHERSAAEDTGDVPPLPHRHPPRDNVTDHPDVSELESVLHRKVHGAFGEGPTEKGWIASTSPAAYSTLQRAGGVCL